MIERIGTYTGKNEDEQMRDWMFTGEDYICDMHFAGVLIRDGKLLVQRELDGNEYALPGGHVQIGEVMTDSLIREFMEEMNAQITCDKLLWTEECFWDNGGRRVHNISFYYRVTLCSESDILDDREFVPQKDNCSVLLGWVPIEMLDRITIYPEFIKKAIHYLDAPCAHFVTIA